MVTGNSDEPEDKLVGANTHGAVEDSQYCRGDGLARGGDHVLSPEQCWPQDGLSHPGVSGDLIRWNGCRSWGDHRAPPASVRGTFARCSASLEPVLTRVGPHAADVPWNA